MYLFKIMPFFPVTIFHQNPPPSDSCKDSGFSSRRGIFKVVISGSPKKSLLAILRLQGMNQLTSFVIKCAKFCHSSFMLPLLFMVHHRFFQKPIIQLSRIKRLEFVITQPLMIGIFFATWIESNLKDGFQNSKEEHL